MNKVNALALLAGLALAAPALADNVSRDEVRAMVAEMLADAETRSSLLQGGGAAGYDNGFFIGSPNGDFKLRFNAYTQFRYVANLRSDDDVARNFAPEIGTDGTPTGGVVDNTPVGAQDEFTNGFQLRKTAVILSGNVINPNLTYNFRFIQQRDTDWQNDDAWVQYNYGDGLTVRAGQFKLPFMAEELNPDTATIAAERGPVNSAFTGGRGQGISFGYTADQFKGYFMFSDGFNSRGTDFTNESEADLAFTARGEFLLSGTWNALRDYTSNTNDPMSAMIGAAAHWQRGSNLLPGASNADEDNFFAYTVDGQVEGGGFSLFGAFVGTDWDRVGNAENTSNFGATLQAAYRWDDAPEIFARWDGLFLDDGANNYLNANGDTVTGDDTVSFITAGFNNYYAGNAAKFTFDAIYSMNDTAGLTGGLVPGGGNPINSNLGLLGSTSSGEIAIRAQFQLSF
jgi:hypothetical protein